MLQCETVPQAWRDGTIVNLFKDGDRTDPGNYRGITLLATVGLLFCRCIQNRIGQAITLHEAQAGFRVTRSCTDNLYVLSDTILQRATVRQPTYVFYLDVRKAFDSTWHDGLWYKLLDKGVGGRMWRTVRNMYAKMRSRVLVNGVHTDYFPVLRGTAQGCTLSPLLFDIFVDGLLEAVDSVAGLGVELGRARIVGLMFADDFAGLATTPQQLQSLIDVVHVYLQKWGLQANVTKSAVVVYGQPVGEALRLPAEGAWLWAGTPIPVKDRYKYLGVFLHANCRWTSHVEEVIAKGQRALVKYGGYLGARGLGRHIRLMVYQLYIRPVLEYGSEIWVPTKTQSDALERIQLEAARRVLGCFGKASSVAILAELGLQPLRERRLQARVRWYSRLRQMGPERMPVMVYEQSTTSPAPRLWRNYLLAQWGGMASAQGNLPALDDLYASEGPQAFLSAATRMLQDTTKHQRHVTMSNHTTLQHLPHISLYDKLQPYLLGKHVCGEGTVLKMRCRTGTLQVNAPPLPAGSLAVL